MATCSFEAQWVSETIDAQVSVWVYFWYIIGNTVDISEIK